MATVAVLVNGARAEARQLADDIVPWLEGRGHRARVLELGDADRAAGHVPAGDLSGADLSWADLAVSLGGDGTFLRMVPLAYAAGIPVMGVNFGRLGYLLEVEPAQLRGRARLGPSTDRWPSRSGSRWPSRSTVSSTPAGGDDRSLPGDGGERWWVALNEMVTEKTVPGHMVHLSTAIDGEPFLSHKADGVLVATPTGSTAYNLSAGGPVVSPAMRAMVVTPVAPHLSIDRSLVLPARAGRHGRGPAGPTGGPRHRRARGRPALARRRGRLPGGAGPDPVRLAR